VVYSSAIIDTQFQSTGTEAQIQPGFSLPKFTEEGLNLQPEPEITIPQDTMKEKEKAEEQAEYKCPYCGTKHDSKPKLDGKGYCPDCDDYKGKAEELKKKKKKQKSS